jgi:hypothetical protein
MVRFMHPEDQYRYYTVQWLVQGLSLGIGYPIGCVPLEGGRRRGEAWIGLANLRAHRGTAARVGSTWLAMARMWK